MIRFFVMGIVVALSATVIASESDNVQKLNNIVCGPRCVQYVLKQFGQDVELADIVREMQWPQLTEGASAASLVAALEKRGVFVKIIQVNPKSTIFAWEHPMILHLKPDDDESLGHFVVRLPQSNDNNIVIVDGLAGVYSKSYNEFCKKMSGVVLLCSPTPIADDGVIVYHRIVLWHWGFGLIGLVFCIAFFHRLYVLARNDSNPKRVACESNLEKSER
jgi:ABC-type bacteriocin/lantibiotic exporter with double-glycine peptidase domain